MFVHAHCLLGDKDAFMAATISVTVKEHVKEASRRFDHVFDTEICEESGLGFGWAEAWQTHPFTRRRARWQISVDVDDFAAQIATRMLNLR